MIFTGNYAGGIFVGCSSAGIDASCSMSCDGVRSIAVKARLSRCLTSKFANDCLANWLGCTCDDTDETVQLAI